VHGARQRPECDNLFRGRSSCGSRRPRLRDFEGGDWYCRVCGRHNFERKKACARRSCPTMLDKSGDWDCPMRQMRTGSDEGSGFRVRYRSAIGAQCDRCKTAPLAPPPDTSRCARWRMGRLEFAGYDLAGGAEINTARLPEGGGNQHGDSKRGAEIKTAMLSPCGFPPPPPAPVLISARQNRVPQIPNGGRLGPAVWVAWLAGPACLALLARLGCLGVLAVPAWPAGRLAG